MTKLLTVCAYSTSPYPCLTGRHVKHPSSKRRGPLGNLPLVAPLETHSLKQRDVVSAGGALGSTRIILERPCSQCPRPPTPSLVPIDLVWRDLSKNARVKQGYSSTSVANILVFSTPESSTSRSAQRIKVSPFDFVCPPTHDPRPPSPQASSFPHR